MRYHVVCAAIMFIASPALAADPREALAQAVFTARDKQAALTQIAAADAAAVTVLARKPADFDAQLTRAMATGYRAKLNHSRSEALDAKAQFETLAARNPREPEALAALGGWHMGAVGDLGGMMARAGLGARKGIGLDALDRSVALGGSRALFPGLAALMRLGLDPRDARGAALAESAAKGSTPTVLDRIVQRRASEMIVALRSGDARLVQALAKRLLPLGQIGK